VKETSVLPTLAQSGHSSKQCMKIDVTTAESSVASGERFLLDYVITGTDYQRLEAQEVTLSFWVRSGLTGTFYVTFKNGGDNRFYMSAQTIDSADTWEKKTITLTLDTAGGATWLYTEADQGLTIRITVMSGSDRQDSGAVDTWLTGSSKDSKSDQTNFLSDTSKDFYISQVGLYIGSSAPTFLGEPISTVKNQVYYYVNRVGGDVAYERVWNGVAINTTTIQHALNHPRRMRAAPTYSFSGTSWTSNGGSTETDTTPTCSVLTTVSANWKLDGLSGMTAGDGYITYRPTAGDYLLFDARH